MTTAKRCLTFDYLDYPGTCCGIGELGGFYAQVPGRYSSLRNQISATSSVDEIDAFLLNRIYEGLSRDEDEYEEDASRELSEQYLLNAYIIEDTPKEWKEYFKASEKWEEGLTWTNTKTGNVITAYSWLITF